jgi:hypothetical protein
MAIIFKRNEAGIDAVKQQGKDYLLKLAEKGVETAKELVPVDTGALRDSIEIQSIDNADNSIKYGSDLGYAYLIEKGTRNTPAQPYLLPSLLIIGNG